MPQQDVPDYTKFSTEQLFDALRIELAPATGKLSLVERVIRYLRRLSLQVEQDNEKSFFRSVASRTVKLFLQSWTAEEPESEVVKMIRTELSKRIEAAFVAEINRSKIQ